MAAAALLPRVEGGPIVAAPMRGMFHGWYGVELTDPGIVGGYHRHYSLFSGAAIGRDVDRSKLEVNVSTIAPLPGSQDGGAIWKADLGSLGTRVASLEYADVVDAVRCNEVLVRVVDGDRETQVMCAVGASLVPSCVQLPVATSTSRLRIELATDGTATMRGIEGATLVHRQHRIVFP